MNEFSPPAPKDPPYPLYSCHVEYCAEASSYPADDLYWAGQWGKPETWGWYCFNCLEHSDDPPENFGLTLEVFLSSQ